MISLSKEIDFDLSGETTVEKICSMFGHCTMSNIMPDNSNISVNSPVGIITIDKKSIKNSVHHGLGKIKFLSFSILKEFFINCKTIQPFVNQKEFNGKNYQIAIVADYILFDNNLYVLVAILTKNKKQKIRLYNHEIIPIDRIRNQETTGETIKAAQKFIENYPPN